MIIALDFEINQYKFSNNLLSFLFLTKVQSQLKIRMFKKNNNKEYVYKLKAKEVVVRTNLFDNDRRDLMSFS